MGPKEPESAEHLDITHGRLGRSVSDVSGMRRYHMTRGTGQGGPSIAWVMTNPATSTEDKDDPTIKRASLFSRGWGYDTVHIVNLYSYRAQTPKLLWEAEDSGTDIIGPYNMEWIQYAATAADVVVLAWGAAAIRNGAEQHKSVLEMLYDNNVVPKCLGYTKYGHPRHPLYLRSDTPLVVWDRL